MMYGGATTLAGPGWALLSLLAIVPWLYVRGGGRFSRRLVIQVLAATYLAVLVGLTLFPLPLPPYLDPERTLANRDFLNVIPLATISDALSRGLYWPAVRFVVGNVVAFVPLGVFAALLLDRPSWRLAAGVGLAVSAAIELGQLGVSLLIGFPYRHADVDDLILNVCGTLLGYAVASQAMKLRSD